MSTHFDTVCYEAPLKDLSLFVVFYEAPLKDSCNSVVLDRRSRLPAPHLALLHGADQRNTKIKDNKDAVTKNSISLVFATEHYSNTSTLQGRTPRAKGLRDKRSPFNLGGRPHSFYHYHREKLCKFFAAYKFPGHNDRRHHQYGIHRAPPPPRAGYNLPPAHHIHKYIHKGLDDDHQRRDPEHYSHQF